MVSSVTGTEKIEFFSHRGCNLKASVVYKKYQKTNALKETHLMKSDRNTTSPTESVVCGK